MGLSIQLLFLITFQKNCNECMNELMGISGWMDWKMEEERMEDRWTEDGCKYRQTARHMDKQTNRQPDRQTYGHTDWKLDVGWTETDKSKSPIAVADQITRHFKSYLFICTLIFQHSLSWLTFKKC